MLSNAKNSHNLISSEVGSGEPTTRSGRFAKLETFLRKHALNLKGIFLRSMKG